MIFNNLRIENFGLFCGKHVFDLQPRKKYGKVRPIVLLGGKNGAGKTTFLESILLALYGRSALRSRLSAKDYQAYLESRIHRPRGSDSIQLPEAAVGLDFVYTHFGQEHLYTVDRRWRRTPKGVEETLALSKVTGDDRESFEEEFAQEFLRNLVPAGVSQLFFFDGERIQSLAEEDADGATLSTSVKSMLSLDLVDQLQVDLKVYGQRQKSSAQDADVLDRLKVAERHLEKLEEERVNLKGDLISIETQIERRVHELEMAEDAFSASGGLLAKQRNELKEQAAALQLEISNAEARIRGECESLLPFALVPELSSALLAQLSVESQRQAWETTQSLVSDRIPVVEESLRKALGGKSSPEETVLDAIGTALLDAFQPPSELTDINPLHKMSPDDTSKLSHWVESEVPKSKLRADEAARELEVAHRTLAKVEQKLLQAPDDDDVADQIREMQAASKRLGALEQESRRADTALRSKQAELDQATRDYNKMMDKLSAEENLMQKLALVDGVQEVLSKFKTRLSKAKATQLANSVTHSYASLSRKTDVVRRVEIDPETFAVTLLSREGRVIPKSELSAGEKQIYAISMLWALARLSGRPLPVIIDTPLGRLDGDHRKHLIEHYFPAASHQVIILSTDTEVDELYFDSLKKSISHAYHLEYDVETESTKASEGYFWKHNGALTDENEQDSSLLRGVGAS